MRWLTTLLLVAFGANAQEAYVSADALIVRADAKPDANVVARLRINTCVTAGEVQGEWTAIDYRGELQGWAKSTYLAKEPVEPEALRAELTPLQGAARIPILERLVALEPGDRAAWDALRREQEFAKNTARATAIKQLLDGDTPLYIAACTQLGVVVLASFDPKKGLTRLTGAPATGDLAKKLQGLRWFGDAPIYLNVPDVRPPPPYEVGGTPFHTPTTDTISHIAGPIAAVKLSTRCTDDHYGDPPSGREPTVFVSSPMYVAGHAADFDWSKASKAVAALTKLELKPPSALRVDSVPLGNKKLWAIHSKRVDANDLLLTTHDFRPLSCTGEICAGGTALVRAVPQLHPWGWLVPALSPSRYVVQIAPYGETNASMGSAGYFIVVVEASGKVHALSVETFQTGC